MHYRISYLLDDLKENRIGIEEATDLTELTKEELLAQIRPFDYTFNRYELTIPTVSPLQWTEKFLGIQAEETELTILERQCMIFLMIYSEEENQSVFHFQDFLGVSRGTVLADIKELRKKIEKESLDIHYDRDQGYSLAGNNYQIVLKAKNCVSLLLQTRAGKFALHYFTAQMKLNLYASIKDQIGKALKQGEVQLVLSRFDEIIYFSVFSRKRLGTHTIKAFGGQKLLQNLTLFKTGKNILTALIDHEVPPANTALYTVCLLSVLQGDAHEPAFDFLLQLAAEIIHEMERWTAIQFNNFRELLFDVYHHLVPAFFRIKYGLILSNVLSEAVLEEYRTIFNFTKKALRPLEEAAKSTTPKDEVAYFTILFGGAMKVEENQKIDSDPIRALIVCPNGVSSSLILETELKQLFPSIEFIGIHSAESIHDLPETEYEVIFSTVPISDTNKNVYVLSPIMSQLSKNHLINQVQKDWLIPGFSFPNAEEIVEAMKPYINLKNGVTEEQLYRVLNRKMNQQFEKVEGKPRLADLLVERNILVRKKVDSWEDAVRIAAQPLLEDGSINQEYIEAMISNINNRGPYIDLGNGMALPHARTEDGSFKVNFSLLVLHEPVALLGSSHHLIDHFVILSVIDHKEHLDALSDLNALMRNKPLLNEFLNSRKPREIINVINRI